MDMLERAIEIAVEAHKGQVDKAGEIYILHPMRVMLYGKTREEKICGILHDVLEDTEITAEQLREEGFDPKILEALQCVTRTDQESYEEFIQRISMNPLAVRVKLADLEDNMDMSRISSPGPEDRKRLEKYRKAKAVLLETERQGEKGRSDG